MSKPQASLREILPGDQQGLDTIAALHMELLNFGPMAALGARFIRDVCYRPHIEEELFRTALYEVDGEAAGFVAYTAKSISFHRESLGRHALQSTWILVSSILEDPSRLGGLARATRVVASRRGELKLGRDPMGEVVCIAVRPKFLAPKFVRRTGLRISEALIRHAAAYLQRSGVPTMRMVVDVENKPVMFLYHRLGARFEDYSQGGAKVTHVWFDLKQRPLTNVEAAPEVWRSTAEAPADAHDGRDDRETDHEDAPLARAEAKEYVRRLRSRTGDFSGMKVLDFGCGHGFVANELAPHVDELHVWDTSARARERALFRLAAHRNVRFLDLSAEPGREAASYDLILAHSAIQYMKPEETAHWLREWRRMLAPAGRIVISDVVSADARRLSELASSLTASARSGLLASALRRGAREFGSYWQVRNTRAFAVFTYEGLTKVAGEAGLSAEFTADKLSTRKHRMSAILRDSRPFTESVTRDLRS